MGTPQTASEGARRKRLGAWYTPPQLVDHVVAMVAPVVPGGLRDPFAVLDPACGDGAFLAGVRRALGPSVRLVGIDVDGDAVASARHALPDAEIIHGDALTFDWGDRRFDLVVGNPPFLNQMATATTRGGRSRFGGGPYADSAAEFLALSVSLAVPDGGRVGIVVPQSLLTTRDSSAIRALVIERAAMTHMWWSDTLMFDAAVRTCAIGFEIGGEQSRVTRSSGPQFEVRAPMDLGTSWAAMLTDQLDVPLTNSGQTLGDIASFTVDFRDQYYGLVGAVGDGFDGPPLITSGLIEPGRCLWGERSVQFAKQRFAAPRVDLERLSPKLRLWAGRRLVPKILIANQTRVIEAVADPIGEWLPSVPVITCTTHDPTTVLAVLSSPAANDWVRYHAAGSGLSASAVRLSPALLAGIPCGLQT